MKRALRTSFGVTPFLVATVIAACAPDTPPVALGPVDGRDLSPVDTGRVAIADVAPDFSLESYDDGVITLSSYRGQRDVILVFYRGWW